MAVNSLPDSQMTAQHWHPAPENPFVAAMQMDSENQAFEQALWMPVYHPYLPYYDFEPQAPMQYFPASPVFYDTQSWNSPGNSPSQFNSAGGVLETPPESLPLPSPDANYDCEEVLKFAEEDELRELLTKITSDFPATGPLVAGFQPRNLLKKAPVDAQVMKTCCLCLLDTTKDPKLELIPFFDVKICRLCDTVLARRPGITRDKVRNMFGFSRREVDMMARTLAMNHRNRSSGFYSYNAKTVANALRQRHGSLHEWVASKLRAVTKY